MKKIHFYLRPNKATAKQTICIEIKEGRNGKTRHSTPFQVLPSDWNKTKMRVKDKADILNRAIINNYLNNIETKLQGYFYECITTGKPLTLPNIKNFINSCLHPEKAQATAPKQYILEFIKYYAGLSQTRISRATGKPLTKIVKYEFNLFAQQFAEFEQTQRHKYTFEELDLNFYDTFINYLQGCNYKQNTIGRNIKTLKTILNQATNEGVNNNLQYKQFKVITETPENIYLNFEELEKIQAVELPNNLNNSRNLFLVGCYTGLRFSDCIRLTPEHIQENFIKITQQKTGKPVVIPLQNQIKSILKQGEIKKISNQKLNQHLKEICRLAGIEETIIKTTTQGGKTCTNTFKKYELVTTHTARRSFATNLYLAGVPSITIMKVTGHKTETAFLKYIKISEQENAKLLQEYLNKNK